MKTSGMRLGSWVKICWRDAVGGSGWHQLKKFRREVMHDSKCISFGKLVEITNEYLIYAPGIGKRGWLQRPGFIPMSLIMSVERVEPVRKKKRKK